MNVAHLRALLLLGVLLGASAVPARVQAQPPAPPHKRGDYLPVEDVPKRHDPAMSPDDRAKLVKELSAARDRQGRLKAKDASKPAKP
jgi:hypothetical protein